ncbi:hypothetical protein M3P19_15610 [Muricauda sp. 2012CJ35-5]|uniref:Uncharacterized protein n=1 Tax=Flagellimonas spongiicola TaxID=2942208 RepID=A0ABT0PWT6_9FLAO|nr:hypothetical protein [Allomuricauda spongiicola]MCL6275441.1 hypothetical protein [Allomuricauda spongiicola]
MGELKIEIDLPEDVSESRMYEVERRINGKPDRINMFVWSKDDMRPDQLTNIRDLEVVAEEVVVKNKITFRSFLDFLGLSFYP